MTIESDIQRLDPGNLVTLFEIDLSPITKTNTADDHLYFVPHTNENSQSVVWQGTTYAPYPIKVDGFDTSTKGVAARPSMVVANVTGILWPMMDEYDDLVGAKVVRRRTYTRYLDDVNFPAIRNLFTRSNELDHAVWTKSNLTLTSGAGYARDGTLSAFQMKESVDGASTSHTMSRTLTGDARNLHSVSLRAAYVEGGRRYLRLHCSSTDTANHARATFDIKDGKVTETFVTGTASDLAASVESDGVGGWRCTVTARPSNALTDVWFVVYLMPNPTGTAVYTGNGTLGPLIYDIQIEEGQRSDYQVTGATLDRNPYADPNQHLPDDVYFVERKIGANKVQATWELASAMDLEGVKIPGRDIVVNFCPWDYRSGEGCDYAGSNYFDVAGNPVATLAQDVCSKALGTGCKKRYVGVPLPFGGFPAARAYKF